METTGNEEVRIGVMSKEEKIPVMNCPAASRGVSFKGLNRFYRSKLRGMRP